MNEIIPIVIPAYEPDEKLIGLLEDLKAAELSPVVVINDGSEGEEYDRIFDKARLLGAVVLSHAVNMGKGRALKNAMNYCLGEYPGLLGIVTADSDGQHKTEDITKCMKALVENPEDLILGVRDFASAGVPARSLFGNRTTSVVMKILTGMSISDTQTGLRGIPSEFMKFLLTEKGERYEFETNMLLDTKELGINIREVPIETIYLEENKSSHFHPVRDSIRIYAGFLKFLFSSLSSSVLDVLLFGIFCSILKDMTLPIGYIMLSTIMARVISAVYNFFINYKVVFKGKGSKAKAAVRYAILAVFIMLMSGFLVSSLHGVLPKVPEFVVKIPVDCVLFLVSFMVQREVVYKN
jgi:glycosyltransferase involved in cell wall biosynthesis